MRAKLTLAHPADVPRALVGIENPTEFAARQEFLRNVVTHGGGGAVRLDAQVMVALQSREPAWPQDPAPEVSGLAILSRLGWRLDRVRPWKTKWLVRCVHGA